MIAIWILLYVLHGKVNAVAFDSEAGCRAMAKEINALPSKAATGAQCAPIYWKDLP